MKKIIKVLLPSYYKRLWDNLAINPQKTFDKLDFTPSYSIKEGVADTIDWYKKAFK